MKRESSFQSALIHDIEARYPGCVVIKNDPLYRQGFPDLLILYDNRWAALECKRSENEHHQPNQDWYVNRLNEMSYSSFIFPENKEAVMRELDDMFLENDL